MHLHASTNGLSLIAGVVVVAIVSPPSANATPSGASSGGVLFVDDDCRTGGDGRTWTTGFQRLQDALTAARAPGSGVTEIRIAHGMHKPDEGAGYTVGDITAAFNLVDGVAVLGGFAGVNAPDPDVRDIVRHETLLDGDLLEDDGALGTWVNYEDNSLHILRADGLRTVTRLDGLTIQRSGSDFDQHFGGGLRAEHSAVQVRACTFAGNRAYAGGGVYVEGGDVTIYQCLFTENRAFNFGGALSAYPHIVLASSTFKHNRSSDHGGALHLTGTAHVSDCAFMHNVAASDGGAALVSAVFGQPQSTFVDCDFAANSADNAGAVAGRATFQRCKFSTNYSSTSGGALMVGGTVIDCLFERNIAANAGGGAIEGSVVAINSTFVGNDSDTYEGGGGAVNLRHPTIPSLFVNCVFNANTTLGAGGAGRIWPGVVADFVGCAFVSNRSTQDAGGAISGGANVANSIIWNNVPSQFAGAPVVTYSSIQGNWPGIGNIAVNPQFLNLAGPDGLAGTEDDDLRLRADSPCIDAGDSTALPADAFDLDGDGDTTEPLSIDLLGNRRVLFAPPHASPPDTGVPDGTGAIIDMGAHEFRRPVDCAPPTPPIGDGFVNIDDLLVVISGWGRCEQGVPCFADINADGVVDIHDLLAVLSGWG